MKKTLFSMLIGGAALGSLILAPSASAATVAAEYSQTNACGWATIPNTKPDASGFNFWMNWFGHSPLFLYGNADFWPNDEVDNSVPGGLDWWYGDRPNIMFFSSHGGSNAARFRMAAGVSRVVDGVNTCTSNTISPTTGSQWWKVGNRNTRILCLSTCQGLQLTDLAHWDAVAQGLHMITGYDGNMSDSPSVGGNFAFWGNMGFSVKQAWFMARPAGNKAVVMAYGTSQAGAISRRENERFSSSMAPLPPHSWRAWAWIQ